MQLDTYWKHVSGQYSGT